MTPVEILDSLCKIRGLNKPEWEGTRKVTFHNHIYNLEDFGKLTFIQAWTTSNNEHIEMFSYRNMSSSCTCWK